MPMQAPTAPSPMIRPQAIATNAMLPMILPFARPRVDGSGWCARRAACSGHRHMLAHRARPLNYAEGNRRVSGRHRGEGPPPQTDPGTVGGADAAAMRLHHAARDGETESMAFGAAAVA